MKRSIFNWSGGKDSALGLYYCLNDKDIEIRYLLTTLSEKYERISMHGVRKELLRLQAKNMGIELKEIYLTEWTSPETYDVIMKNTFDGFKQEGIEYSIFGDIFGIKKTVQTNGMDLCGENGEFHSMVFNSPDFLKRVILQSSKIISADEFHYLDIKEVSLHSKIN